MIFIDMIDFIPDLLYKHNCVIIPEFGGFLTNFKQSGFEENRNVISPSSKKVAFNQSLIENDGLLVNHWSKIKNISYQQSLEEVENFSNYLKEKIKEYRSFDFKNVGTFYLTNENNLLFVPYQGLNFLESSYGLFPVKIRFVNSIPFTALEDNNVVEIANSNEINNEISEDEIFHTKTTLNNVKFSSLLKVASVFISVIVITLAMYFVNLKTKSKNTIEYKSQVFYTDSNTDKKDKPKIKKISIPSYTKERKEIEEIKSQLDNFNKIQESSKVNYEVIVGYYKDFNVTNRLFNKLKAEYPNSKMNEKTESGYSITVESFYTYNTANVFSVMLKQNGFKEIKIEKNIVFGK